MRFKSFLIVCGICVLFCISCSKTQCDPMFDQLRSSKNYLLLIPVEGCSDCIKKSLNFGYKWCDNKEFEAIIHHYDYKLLNIVLKSKEMETGCLKLDTGNLYKGDFTNASPILFDFLNCEKIILNANNIDDELQNLSNTLKYSE